MFRKPTSPTTTSPTAADPSRDPSSRMYIPDELRPHYRVDPIGDARMWSERDEDHLAKALLREALAADPGAWEAAKQERRRERTRGQLRTAHRGASDEGFEGMLAEGPAAYSPTWQEVEAARSLVTDEDRAWWLHRKRLERAATERAAAEVRAGRAAERRSSLTCEVCGEFTPRTRARAIGHDRGVGVIAVATAGDVRACDACAEALDAAVRAQSRAEVIGDGRTREEAAADFLAAR